MIQDRATEWLNVQITRRSRTIVVTFLLLTAVFAVGLGSVETESGQGQFIEDLPSFEALEDVQRDFGSSFGPTRTSTTLIQESNNVLSKPAILEMLRAQERIAERDPLRVTGTSSPARSVARAIEPNATTLDAQIRAVEGATPSEVDAAVRRAAEEDPSFLVDVSDDFNRRSASADAARASVTHAAGQGAGGGGAGGGPAAGGGDFPPNRVERVDALLQGSPSIRTLGSVPNTITDSLIIILPAALVFIVLFLIVAYRDPVDLLLGIVSIVMTIVWTFGFLGLAGIPFNVLLVAVPPLLLAIGIDFGIHAVNRYREERVREHGIDESMRLTAQQVGVAFFIVMVTSAIGFLSNMVSAFPPVRDFGFTAAVGIVFTFLIFGVFLPAGKVWVDRLRERYPIPTVSDSPLGSESSPLGRALSGGVVIAERAPVAFVLLLLLSTAGTGVYAAGVDTGFSPDDFLPAEETPEYLQALPEPFRPPAEFESVKDRNFIDENFQEDGRVLMFIEGPMREDAALEGLHRAGNDPPPTFRGDDRQAESQSIVSVVRSRAERDPDFRRLVRRTDGDGDGIPDDDLPEVYGALSEGPGGSQVGQFLSADRRSALVIYTVDGDASDEAVTADARAVAERFRYEATPTGNAVIFDEAIALLFESVIESLLISLVGASAFLVAAYWALNGRPSLGIVNAVPIAITVVAVVASMRAFGIKFNAINGTLLAITIGLGIDYSVHIVHRFADEFDERSLDESLRRTVVGTGGALTGSMLTTVFGVGVIALALNPALGVFGILTAMSVFYAYVASVFLLPSFLVLWARLVEGDRTTPPA